MKHANSQSLQRNPGHDPARALPRGAGVSRRRDDASLLRLRARVACGAWLCPALLAFGATHAADPARPLRDPLVAPVALQTAPSANAAAGAQAAPGAAQAASTRGAPRAARHIMIVDGESFVIEGGRRRSVGDMRGSARIERIEEQAIWLREAGTLQRLPMFGPAIRRATGPVDPALKPPAVAAEKRGGEGRPPLRTTQLREP